MSSRPFTALALAAVLLLGACAGQQPAGTPLPSDFPSVRFAVVSDLHFGEEARTPQDAPASGATLVEHSGAIFAAMCDEISAAQPDFLLVCGDMADAGDIASHQRVEQQLAVLRAGGRAEGYGARARGIRVFVVPGNHDIPNGEKAAPGAALKGTESAAGAATEEDFQRIYEADGWSDASRRDTGSLSYAAPLAPGLLLLALDSRALDNGREAAGGSLSAETRQWAQGVLADARRSSTRVIVLIHHGVMEHFRGERTFVPGALVADDDAVAEFLAAGGVRVVFSGHGHAQDITKRSFPLRGEDCYLFDVETGAAASWPNPWRMVSLEKSGEMRIESHFITRIAGMDNFEPFARERLRAGIFNSARSRLRHIASARDAELLSARIADAGMLLARGDEPGRQGVQSAVRTDTVGLSLWGSILRGLAETSLRDLRTDLPPADNDVTLSLAGGTASP